MNNENPAPCPIFIHSLFRSGSTYLFNVFRRSADGYWCYQEPENEFLTNLNGSPDRLIEMAEETENALRHPRLDKPYFWEFYELRHELSGLFQKSFSYDNYFAIEGHGLTPSENQYFRTLIEKAHGRPVLQFCRSAGRAGAMKSAFGGIHVHLWREPRSQWWSLKINDYFEAAIQLIYNAKSLPPLLQAAKTGAGIADIHNSDVNEEFRIARQHPLTHENSYFAFYALWVFSFLENERCSDITLNIDALSRSTTYREGRLLELSTHQITNINFDDCKIPAIHLTASESAKFADIEHRVIELFLQHGHSKDALDKLKMQALAASPDGNVLEQSEAARARAIALWSLDQTAAACYQLGLADGEQTALKAALDKSTETAANLESALVDIASKRSPGIEAELIRETERRHNLEAAVANLNNEWHKRLGSLEKQLDEATLNVHRWQNIADERAKQLETTRHQLQESLDNARHWSLLAGQEEAQLQSAQLQLNESLRNLDRWSSLASAHEARLNEVFASSSWRITWPLRASKNVLMWLLRSPALCAKTLIRRVAIATANSLLKWPQLHRNLVERLRYYPRFFAHLRQFALHHRIIQPSETGMHIHQSNHIDLSTITDADLKQLTPRAREIYSDLKRALAVKKET